MSEHNPKNHSMMILGRKIRAAREYAGLTQEELADKAEVNRTTLSKIENGLAEPRARTLLRLARALKVPPAHLWDARFDPIISYDTIPNAESITDDDQGAKARSALTEEQKSQAEELHYEPVNPGWLPPALDEMLTIESNRLRYGITEEEEAMLRSIRTRSLHPMTREFFEEVLIAYRRHREY